jgi:hypothetical protein
LLLIIKFILISINYLSKFFLINFQIKINAFKNVLMATQTMKMIIIAINAINIVKIVQDLVKIYVNIVQRDIF